MSAVKSPSTRPNNSGRALPPIPDRPADKAERENEPIPGSPEPGTLASIILKEVEHSPSERPRLNQHELQEKQGSSFTESSEIQTLRSENSPLPTPQSLPNSPTKVERRLTASGKRPILLRPFKSESKAQKSSPKFSPTFSLSPRTLKSLEENSTIDYFQAFDDLATELTDTLDPEIATSERPAALKSEMDSLNKRPEKSNKPQNSLEDLGISAQSLVGPRSPEKTSARLSKLQRVSLVKPLPTEHRRPREKPLPSNAAVRKDLGGTDPGSENSGAKNN